VMLIDHISDAGMQCSLSTRGGRDVARQFAHLHNVRVQWLDVSAKDLAKGLKKFGSKTSPSKAALKKDHAASTEAIATWLGAGVDNGGKVKSPFQRNRSTPRVMRSPRPPATSRSNPWPPYAPISCIGFA
jgi:hypothetical protein